MLLKYVLCVLWTLFRAVQCAEKIYEPNPPVTHRVLMTVEYTDQNTLEVKEHDITIELYGTVVEKTVENFQKIAGGIRAVLKGKSEKLDSFTLSYKDTLFHRIIPGFMIQGGNVLPDVGPFSIYGTYFADESFELKHDRPGRVSMANLGKPDSNASQFFITTSTEPIPDLDGKHVVFGQVVAGLEGLIEHVQHVPTDKDDKPLKDVKVKYSLADTLQLANKEELHAKYQEKLKKFKEGDSSQGVTMKAMMAKGKEEEAEMVEELYAKLHHPLLKVLGGLSVVGLLYLLARNRKRIFSKTSNVVSMRHD
ncbi:LAMI_0G11694g1_1 [Lachancea mirantina]|uniref:peptidylprolyl isomerase n=1 Tax=Lachancea mirantina TaxID=1230905 RepID=A0A1G4KBB7_9SACH|nr:LAMI_0G11694g1_1 [Lachancea mirantina]